LKYFRDRHFGSFDYYGHGKERLYPAKRGGKGCEVSSTMTNRAREEGLLATSLCGFGSLDTGYVGPLI